MLTTIEETQHRYAIIDQTLEHSEIALFWCDKDRIIMLNRSFCLLTGFSKEELLKKNFDDISSKTPRQLSINEIFSNTTDREYHIFTWIIATADKKTVSVELRLTRFFLGDDKPYYFGLVRNLSKRDDNEGLFSENVQRLSLAMQVSRQGMWEWNTVPNETFYSKEYYAILGYEDNAFVPSHINWQADLHPDDLDIATTIWDDFVASKSDRYTDEFRLKTKSGHYIWVHSEGMVIDRDADGDAIRIVGIVANINEKRLNEIKVQEQTQKLIDYTFFNSHRLRAPLSSILGLAEILKHEYSPEIVASLDKVSKQLDEVVHEINQILVGDTSGYKLNAQSPIRKVSLVGEDKVFHIVYKKTFERFANKVETTSHQMAAKVLEMMKEKVLDTDLIILDMNTNIDVWEFLDGIQYLHNIKPVYLLTNDVTMHDAIKASEYDCVKGILLKPMGRQAIINFISQVNN